MTPHFSHAALTALLSTSLLLAPVAEAKRLGGGKSYGSSRSYSTPSRSSSNYTPPAQRPYSQQPSAAASAYPAPAQSRGVGMGTVAGAAIAAGAAGYALGHANNANATAPVNDGATTNGQWGDANAANAPVTQQSNGGMSWLWLLLIGAGLFFWFRRMRQRQGMAGVNATGLGHAAAPQNSNWLNKAPVQPLDRQPFNPASLPPAGAAHTGTNTLADGTPVNEFLRDMRNRFRHLQTMNGQGSLNEIRHYMTPELFAQMQGEIAANTDPAEFPQLSAQLLGSQNEGQQYTASVLFNGTVIESLGAAETPFQEVWHLVKPAGSPHWQLMGIEQV